MFNGIINGRGRVEEVHAKDQFRVISISLPPGIEKGLATGASVAIDGVCLTVTKISGKTVQFDVMQETLARSTLGELKVADEVNIERSAKEGADISGHPISGHVDCVAEVVKIETPPENKVLTFKLPSSHMRYIFEKGYVALNGASLTVTNVRKPDCLFDVWFIPETLRLTTFDKKIVGNGINVEIDRGTQVMVDTVRDFLEERFGLSAVASAD